MQSKLIPLALALALVGCASSNKKDTSVPPAVAQAQQAKAAESARVQQIASDIPDWFIKPPQNESMLYAAATAASPDLQLAIDKAVNDAKAQLADRLNGEMSGKMKRFIEESGSASDPQLLQETSKVTSALFTSVNLAGYRVSDKKIVPQGTLFRAYTLLEYPIGEANRVLVSEIKKNQSVETRLRASKAFADLEAEIEAARKRKAGG